MNPSSKPWLLSLALSVLGAVGIALGSAMGSTGWEPWWQAVQQGGVDPVSWQIMWDIRLPRSVGAWAGGALLGLAGARMVGADAREQDDAAKAALDHAGQHGLHGVGESIVQRRAFGEGKFPEHMARGVPFTADPDANPRHVLRAEVKQQDSTGENEKMLRSERYFGAVSRSFQLPLDIDQDQANAKYDNGVLTLTLPKKRASGGAQRLRID